MKTILTAAAALSFLAVTAYASQSKAEDVNAAGIGASAEPGDLMELLVQEDGVGDDVLNDMSGRELIEPDELTQIAAPTNNNTTTNEIELNDGSSLTTGLVAGNQANSGGINNQMINSGNGVNFQNSTVIQIIVGE